jgi:hypothetical protein
LRRKTLPDDHQLILYTGTLCHLCNDAKTILYGALPANIHFEESNIDEEPDKKNTYGCRIPVFVVKNGAGKTVAEKDWPFTPGQIKKMLRDCRLN